MANEATLTIQLNINKGNLQYQAAKSNFSATVTGTKGPTPGAITASITGTNIDLSQLVTPGFCRICNLDATNFVEVGIFDGDKFSPLMEILPGEFYVIRLSRNVELSYVGGGTGTNDSGNYLRVRANTAPCVVTIEAFET